MFRSSDIMSELTSEAKENSLVPPLLTLLMVRKDLSQLTSSGQLPLLLRPATDTDMTLASPTEVFHEDMLMPLLAPPCVEKLLLR